MGTIKIGRDSKREYESVNFFAESDEPKKEVADGKEQQQEAVPQQPQQAEGQEPVGAEKPAEKEPSAKTEKVPVAKQPRKKGGKR